MNRLRFTTAKPTADEDIKLKWNQETEFLRPLRF